MEFKPEVLPTPKVLKLEGLNITLNQKGLPVVGKRFETTIVYDNGTRIEFVGIVSRFVIRDNKIFAVITNDKNPSGIEFPVPNEVIQRAKNSR